MLIEEQEETEVEDINIVPDSQQIHNTKLIFASWTEPAFTSSRKVYLNVEDENHYAMAANGWNFTTQATAPGVDNVLETYDHSVTVERGGTYTLIVVTYNGYGVENGRGSVEITIPPYDEEDFYDVDEYKANGTYPTSYGEVFAGWYSDETCTEVYTNETGKAYAKFVDKDVLGIKAQMSGDQTIIRFVSSVDSLNYSEVGFVINGTYGDRTITNKIRRTNTVYQSIKANHVALNPKEIFSDSSEYFIALAVTGLDPTVKATWSVQPYWITEDGTTVYGATGTYES